MLIPVVGGKTTSVAKATLEAAVAFSQEIWERGLVQFSVCVVKLACVLDLLFQLRPWLFAKSIDYDWMKTTSVSLGAVIVCSSFLFV